MGVWQPKEIITLRGVDPDSALLVVDDHDFVRVQASTRMLVDIDGLHGRTASPAKSR